MSALDVAAIKRDFPILEREVNGKRVMYLDSASSAQKPLAVLDAMDHCYRTLLRQHPPRRLHDRRGGHRRLRARAPQGRRASSTRASESRDRLHAQRDRGDQPRRVHVGPRQPARRRRDRAHAHGAPRQRRAVAHARRRARRRAALDPDDRRLPARPHRTSTSCSTAPACSRSPRCRTCSARSTTSARSPTPRTRTTRSCSSTPASTCRTSPPTCRPGTPTSSRSPSHKMCGPSGIGALWARQELLEEMPPFLGGGEMIRDVRLDGFTTNDVPWKFEAGTQPIVEAIGFGAAVDYIDRARHGRRPRPRDAAHPLHARRARATASPTSLTIYGPLDTSTSAAARSRSCSTASTPTTSARSSTRTPCACGPATTAPSR